MEARPVLAADWNFAHKPFDGVGASGCAVAHRFALATAYYGLRRAHVFQRYGREETRLLMGKRVNIDGPGDDPDEYWFECDDCEGTGTMSVTDYDADEDGRVTVEGTCPGCDGFGFIGGDADDVDD